MEPIKKGRTISPGKPIKKGRTISPGKPIKKGRTISPGSYYAMKGIYRRKMARKRKIIRIFI